MFVEVRKLIAVVIGLVGMVSAAQAVPVTYSFTSGLQISATGSGVGLLGAGETVSGTFEYDSEGAFVGNGIFGGPTGATFQSVRNIHGLVGGRAFFDEVAGSEVEDERGAQGLDLITVISSSVGGGWSTFNIGSLQLQRMRILWQEDPARGFPDFLTGNTLPDVLPSFIGLIQLDFGTDLNNITGRVVFQHAIARVVGVPEPASLLLAFAGFICLVTARRYSLRP